MTTLKMRNVRYSISDMVPGDRFYLLGDKKKLVYSLRFDRPFAVIVQAGFHIKYAFIIDDKGTERKIKAKQFCFFLRNVNKQP